MEKKGGEPKGRRLRAKAEERRKAGRELGPGLRGGWWTEWEASPLWHKETLSKRTLIDAGTVPRPPLQVAGPCRGVGGGTLGVVVIAVPGVGVLGKVWCIGCPKCMPL